ncbi:MAG: hypothetical protein ACRCYY_20770 [Trueperaceae bacterium]
MQPFIPNIEHVSGVSVGIDGLPFKELDLYEYYWADKVQGKITWYTSLWFLIRTSFSSLNFRKQLPILLESRKSNGKKRSYLHIISKEIFTSILFLFIIALLVTLLIIVGATSPVVFRDLQNFGPVPVLASTL